MKDTFKILAAAALAMGAHGKPESMEAMKLLKQQTWDAQRAAGVFDIDRYSRQAATSCTNGKAGEYSCENVDLVSFLRHQDMGSSTREGNDVWGWTSNGREFAAVGQTDGTAFVEVKSDGSLVYLGRLPTQTVSSSWRDLKVIGDHIYIGSEAKNHGLQIFDMKKLLNLDPSSPKNFSTSSDLTALYQGFGSSHNIVAHAEANMIYAVGTSRDLSCRGGLWMVDVSNPAKPTSPGCLSAGGYVHDAQCVTYKGPDTRYTGREICFNFNEDSLDVTDVTVKSAPKTLSSTAYSGVSYTHQGWLVGSDMKFLLLDDEQDEMNKAGPAANQHTTTYIVDVSNLTQPIFTGTYQSPVKSIDHNQFVVDGRSYQANYGSGLRVVDARSLAIDPTGGSMKQLGFFDCHPEDDSIGGEAEFEGSWGVYPFFKSGYIILNSIERGVYSLKYTGS